MVDKIEQNLCPFCQATNNCMVRTESSCWCNSVKVPQHLIDLLAEKQKGKCCICESCINLFLADPVKFAANVEAVL